MCSKIAKLSNWQQFIFFISMVFSLIPTSILAITDEYIPEFTRPKTFDFITNVPNTLVTSWQNSFNTKPETLWFWGAIASSTLLLYIYDEDILNACQHLGRSVHLGNDDHTKPMIKYKNTSIFRGPTDAGSALYFLGDGWMHSFIGAGFVISGAITSNNRALQTGSQLFHGLISSTIPNQVAKRSFGRESPYRRSHYRGKWDIFPSFTRYNGDTSKYDAMPTGHLMTATMTFTIIDSNYPEYRFFIRPFALTWMTLLGFQMVNNGVHWMSDYPLGMAMGYVVGKVASNYGRVKKNNNSDQSSAANTSRFEWDIFPIAFNDNELGHIYGATLNLKF
ncbi:MAG: phosphatase PAP2 family protein [Oligoflexia bacterium]|nr:phosphatase PAP2 family protein [Oligoflexia bacterium]